MRVTHTMLFRNSLANLDRQRSQLSRTQEQISSGLRINRPSDDPLGAGTAMTLRAASDASQQLQRNGNHARSRLLAVDDAVAQASDLIVRARELALQGANASQDSVSRDQLAREVEALHNAMLGAGNTRFGGAYVFAGYTSDASPFEVSGPFTDVPPTSPTVSYVGDGAEIAVPIEEGSTARVSFDGRRVFQGDANGDGLTDPGRVDVFAMLAGLRDALRANDPEAVAAALPSLDLALDQMSTERTRVGSEVTRIEAAGERLSNRELRLAERLSEVQDADLATAVSSLVRQETALEASLSVMGRLLPPTLMDFLG